MFLQTQKYVQHQLLVDPRVRRTQILASLTDIYGQQPSFNLTMTPSRPWYSALRLILFDPYFLIGVFAGILLLKLPKATLTLLQRTMIRPQPQILVPQWILQGEGHPRAINSSIFWY